MIKVCHVTSVHPAKDARIFHKECRSLAKEYEVYLIAPNVKDEIAEGVHILGVSLPKGRLKRMLNLDAVYKKALEVDAAVYHFHDPELMRIGLQLKRKGKTIVFDSHEDVPLDIQCRENIPYIFRKTISLVYGIYEKTVLKRYDAVISVTPTIVERLKKANDNTVQITNYPILEANLDNRSWKKKIGFIGGIVKSWNHEVVIKCIEDLDVRYSLAGRDYSGYVDELEKLPGWRNVDFYGFLKHEDAIKLLGECTIGMALYHNDSYLKDNIGTLGNTKMFEYMMAGIPVIATNFILWKNIVEKYNCGICVDPTNTKEIVDAIQFLLNNPDVAKTMGDNGRKAIEDTYNWNTQAEILMDLYHRFWNEN